MEQNLTPIVIKEIKAILPKLSPKEIMELDHQIHDYLENSLISRAAETAFSDWDDPEEDIYNDL